MKISKLLGATMVAGEIVSTGAATGAAETSTSPPTSGETAVSGTTTPPRASVPGRRAPR
jgi:hypothetical protein